MACASVHDSASEGGKNSNDKTTKRLSLDRFWTTLTADTTVVRHSHRKRGATDRSHLQSTASPLDSTEAIWDDSQKCASWRSPSPGRHDCSYGTGSGLATGSYTQ